MAKFIDAEIDSNAAERDLPVVLNFCQAIKDVFLAGAEGMFLWVSMEGRKVLLLVAARRRPLTTIELQTAVAVEPGNQERQLDVSTRRSEQKSSGDGRRTLYRSVHPPQRLGTFVRGPGRKQSLWGR
ncbi:hypothetical protein MCOR27_005108 [Pyricularia oryzae]|uniref:Uncharacterized protein n=2 Tax=Pyricularia TaxID=48558 RepID=A0ABQ8N8E6_PYRGI|nr:hypothetical protein MCOR01_003916 [Pyricularia oryzae]KAI6292924.1 hypothetical protein MCOR33_009499 [Pyricularia grisea]KAH9430541.1 hypothetical protein MCOR02_007876 [Pyricularia oryzae]KAI6258080.1 hypothetical protein MCOR19_005530 [Pyricularia oryzae]KAI6267475.1 hypothetical protein MCOR26_009690 [Pyricularia oryzae]